MLAKIKGYKTLIVAGFLLAYAAASFVGIDVPMPDGSEAIGLTATIMALLRFVTTGKVGEK